MKKEKDFSGQQLRRIWFMDIFFMHMGRPTPTTCGSWHIWTFFQPFHTFLLWWMLIILGWDYPTYMICMAKSITLAQLILWTCSCSFLVNSWCKIFFKWPYGVYLPVILRWIEFSCQRIHHLHSLKPLTLHHRRMNLPKHPQLFYIQNYTKHNRPFLFHHFPNFTKYLG